MFDIIKGGRVALQVQDVFLFIVITLSSTPRILDRLFRNPRKTKITKGAVTIDFVTATEKGASEWQYCTIFETC